MSKVTFTFGTQVMTIDAPNGQTILQIALDNNIPMEHACGGNGFCTTCICTIREGMPHLNERNDREENMGITMDPYRLSCQARVKGDGDIALEMEGF